VSKLFNLELGHGVDKDGILAKDLESQNALKNLYFEKICRRDRLKDIQEEQKV